VRVISCINGKGKCPRKHKDSHGKALRRGHPSVVAPMNRYPVELWRIRNFPLFIFLAALGVLRAPQHTRKGLRRQIIPMPSWISKPLVKTLQRKICEAMTFVSNGRPSSDLLGRRKLSYRMPRVREVWRGRGNWGDIWNTWEWHIRTLYQSDVCKNRTKGPGEEKKTKGSGEGLFFIGGKRIPGQASKRRGLRA